MTCNGLSAAILNWFGAYKGYLESGCTAANENACSEEEVCETATEE